MQIDYPLIRKECYCPLCNRPKAQGCVVCWGCYREHDMKYGEAPAVTHQLQKAEHALKHCAFAYR